MKFTVTLILFLLLGCSLHDQAKSKGGSETTNGITALIQDSKGNPVANARVSIRPADYNHSNTLARKLLRSLDTITDSEGRVDITSLDSGAYSMEINDDRANAALLQFYVGGDSILELGSIAIRPYIKVRGNIDTTDLQSRRLRVQILGTERVMEANADGSFAFDSIPPATVFLRVSSINSSDEETVIAQCVPVVQNDIVTITPTLPIEWLLSQEGSSVLVDGVFVLSDPRYIYQKYSGDILVESEVTRMDSLQPHSYAYAMIRNSFDSDAAFASTAINSKGVFMIWRANTGSEVMQSDLMVPSSGPVEIKMERIADSLLSFYSIDGGKVWVRIGAQSIVLGDSVYAGVGVEGGTTIFKNPTIEVVQ